MSSFDDAEDDGTDDGDDGVSLVGSAGLASDVVLSSAIAAALILCTNSIITNSLRYNLR